MRSPLQHRPLARFAARCMAAGLAGIASAGAAPAAQEGRIDDARLAAAASGGADWLVDGGNYAGWHYSSLSQIDAGNVDRLKPAWFFELDTTRGQESEPVVVDGVMYVSSAWSKVYALDAATGRLKWQYDPQVPGEVGARACCDVVNRGVAVYRGRVYVATLDGRLVALDARTGRVRWLRRTVDQRGMYTITGVPRIVRGKVIIGNGGAEFGVRGYVSAYDADSGRLVWRFYTVPAGAGKPRDGAASDEVLERVARPTWAGDWSGYGGGATAWNALSYDTEQNLLFVGTGNGSPWNHRFRSAGQGDNLFLCSIIALDADTGRYRWHYQVNPAESWDYNAVMPMIQADLTIDGRARKVLMQAPKNGFFYVLDRTNGKLVSAQPFVDGITWATRIDVVSGRPVEVANARYEQGEFRLSPSPAGAHNWHPMAFSPQTGWVYFSGTENAALMRSEARFTPLPPPVDSTGAEVQYLPTTRRYLQAWDPVTNTRAWRVEQPAGQQPGGALATAGGIVFQGIGAVTGELVAYRAKDGARLWSHRLPNAPLPAPVSYSIGGMQYIAVLSGARGAGGGAGGPQALSRQNGRIAVFRLDGDARTPADPPRAAPANPPAEAASAALVAAGEAHYARLCGRCHGPATQSANVIPDLRRAAAVTDAALWQSIVIGGALRASGMVSWGHVLDADGAEAIRAYVGQQARILQSIEEKSGP